MESRLSDDDGRAGRNAVGEVSVLVGAPEVLEVVSGDEPQPKCGNAWVAENVEVLLNGVSGNGQRVATVVFLLVIS